MLPDYYLDFRGERKGTYKREGEKRVGKKREVIRVRLNGTTKHISYLRKFRTLLR